MIDRVMVGMSSDNKILLMLGGELYELTVEQAHTAGHGLMAAAMILSGEEEDEEDDRKLTDVWDFLEKGKN